LATVKIGGVRILALVSDHETTAVVEALTEARTGDGQAVASLFSLVYTQLRRIAGGYFRGQREEHTLQPTALVHEAFMRLVRQNPACWQDRKHFIAVAAIAMRQILIEHARRRGAAKRGAAARRVTFDEGLLSSEASGPDTVDILALDAALRRLETLSPRQARVIELQYFGGMTVEEVAEVLEVSKGLVEKDWRRARAFIKSALADNPEAG
jgi:RNA polymerase sigma factor (TIGR02999 family)